MLTTVDGFKVNQVTFKEEVLDALKAFHDEVKDTAKFKKSIATVQKLWKNVLDNPNDEKFRTVKT